MKACHPVLLAHRKAIGRSFYQLLFKQHPDTQNLFNLSHLSIGQDGEPGSQMLALSDAVICYAQHIDQLDKLGDLVERVCNKHVSFGVESEHYPVVGTILLQALEDVLGKEIFNEDVKAAVAEAYFFLADIFIAKEEEMKKEKEEIEGGWRGWRKMVLKKKIEETPLHTSFYFSPEDEGALMSFLPGQYITIKIDSSPYTSLRNYSLSSQPSMDMYRITVKREEGGQVSSYLHENANEGDVFEIGVPCGDFTVSPDDTTPLVLLGAGTGITPLLGILDQARQRGVQAILIYRAHSSQVHPLRQEVEDIVTESQDISCHVFYSVDDAGDDDAREYSVDALDTIIQDKNSLFYICGPEGFTLDTINMLTSLGVGQDRVKIGPFGPMVLQTKD